MSCESVRQWADAARAFLATAETSLVEALRQGGPSAQAQVAATNAITAGIAACDAICGKRLGHRSSGQDHAEAAALLATVTPGGQSSSATMKRLTSRKSVLQYGDFCTAQRAQEMVDAATVLVQALSEHDV